MQDPIREIEREAMLVSRHALLGTPRTPEHADRLDRSAYLLLSRIEAQGPLSIPQLQEAFGLDTSTLHRQTTAMLKAGLVERILDPDGGLARQFRITDLGHRRLHAHRAEIVDGLGRILDGWTADDLRTLADSLRRFNEALEAHDQRPWPRADRAAGT